MDTPGRSYAVDRLRYGGRASLIRQRSAPGTLPSLPPCLDAWVAWPPGRTTIAATFDQRADSYDDGPMHRWLAAEAAALLSTVVPGPGRFLDAAAGTALAGRAFATTRSDVELVAVDLSPGLLEVARQHRGVPVLADVERLPFRSKCFDGLLCVSAAAYFPKPVLALQEFARVLRPGCFCVVQVWAENAITATRLYREAAAAVGITVADPNEALGTPERLRAAVAQAGFATCDIRSTTWEQSWSDAAETWTASLDGVLGDELRALDAASVDQAREHFFQAWHRVTSDKSTDSQAIVLALAGTFA
jgi:ubiquinone/menaquinone biosynthesis C-methylase UbiE